MQNFSYWSKMFCRWTFHNDVVTFITKGFPTMMYDHKNITWAFYHFTIFLSAADSHPTQMKQAKFCFINALIKKYFWDWLIFSYLPGKGKLLTQIQILLTNHDIPCKYFSCYLSQTFKLNDTINFRTRIICITSRITEKLFSQNSKFIVYLYAYYDLI